MHLYQFQNRLPSRFMGIVTLIITITMIGCASIPNPRKVTDEEMSNLSCKQLRRLMIRNAQMRYDSIYAAQRFRDDNSGLLGAVTALNGGDAGQAMARSDRSHAPFIDMVQRDANGLYNKTADRVAISYEAKGCGDASKINNQNFATEITDLLTTWPSD